MLGAEPHFEGAGAGGHAWLEAGGVELGFRSTTPEIRPVRARLCPGAVDAVDVTGQELLDRGRRHHRGPVDIAEDGHIRQLVDPFGTVFGLDGPA